jgi:hypothetical protein
VTDADVLALLRQSAFSFVGTVERLGAATMADVPIDRRTAVVHVDRVLHAPAAFAHLEGSTVTVQLATAAKEGEQLAFFTNGLAFGTSIAVTEVGRRPATELAPHVARAEALGGGPLDDLQAQLDAEALREHAKDAAAVLTGRVTALAQAAPVGMSEHDPVWCTATIDVEHVERGRGVGGQVAVLYPNSLDVRWHDVPKPKMGQEGLFILHATDRALRPLAKYQLQHPEDLQPVQSLDALTPDAGGR